MKKEEIFDRPPGPLFGFWSSLYIDKWKFIYRNVFTGSRKERKNAFIDTLKSGDAMPPVKLKTTEDVEFILEDFKGKKIKIGRARMFEDKTKVLDDPGMFALNRLSSAF